MKMNLFAEAAMNATAIKAQNLYGQVTEASEADVSAAYAEALNLAYSAGTMIHLFAESANSLAERIGAYAAVMLYDEAEGGFFKKILDAIIKLFEKVKTFFKTLLGRFKSNKAYREDITKLQSAIKTIKGYNFQDKATVTVKTHAWAAIAKLVTGILNDKSVIFEEKYAGKTVGEVADGAKNIIVGLEGGDAKGSTVKSITDTLDEIRKEYSTVDMWTKHLYGEMIKGASLGSSKADFGKNSSQTPAEAINNLWSADTKTLKGNDIKNNAVADAVFKAIGDGTAGSGLEYDSMVKALEEGETFFTDKSNELKDALNELQKVSQRINTSTKKDDEEETAFKAKQGVASSAANIASNYSTVLSNYSTICLNAFNTGRLQLDKLLSEAGAFINAADKAREQYGNKETTATN